MNDIKIDVGVKKMAVLYRFEYLNKIHYFNKKIEIKFLFIALNINKMVETVKVDLDSIPVYYSSHKDWLNKNK